MVERRFFVCIPYVDEENNSDGAAVYDVVEGALHIKAVLHKNGTACT